MQSLTDNELMLKVKSGDLDKMGLIYERHKKRLFGFFYSMNFNIALSEDLVQNVFVRMLKYRKTFTGEGSFVTWMFKVARNVNYDHYKKHKKEISNSAYTTLEYRLPDMEDLNQTMDFEDDVSQLNRALRKLSPEKREILILSKFKEIRFSEIGKILGCSEGTAKVKAYRALKELKAIFLQLETR